MGSSIIHTTENTIAKAFGKQAVHFDNDDLSNQILVAWRKQIYNHVDRYLKPNSRILELNAGTGIDAVHFAKKNHVVHSTDLANEMIDQIKKKVDQNNLNNLTYEQCSYQNIDQIKFNNFDYVFSNFGGLNCCKDLESVTRLLPQLISPSAYITWVIMPPVSLWEFSRILKGKWSAFRRLKKNGTLAQLEGEHFKTYYYSLQQIKKAFGPRFKLIKSEGLGALSPPPASHIFIKNYPNIFKLLQKTDEQVRHSFPFNRWADHIIVTFQFLG